jgi:hypothetical protein
MKLQRVIFTKKNKRSLLINITKDKDVRASPREVLNWIISSNIGLKRKKWLSKE